MKIFNQDAMSRAKRSLLGLSIGDAFGQSFFGPRQVIIDRIQTQTLLPAPWIVTDDTIQALAVINILDEFGSIRQDELAAKMGDYYLRLPNRGYGGTANGMLKRYGSGESWREIAPNVFSGQGSKGNGCAMRIAPLGAYYADLVTDSLINNKELNPHFIEECRKATEVTHMHEESEHGALAIALASAMTCHEDAPIRKDLLRLIIKHLPDGTIRSRLRKSLELPMNSSVELLLTVMGNSRSILVEDTVPFCLWQAAMYPENYEEAMWLTMIAGGDKDTTCAIVGGIVVNRVADTTIPDVWRERTEDPYTLFPE